MKNHCPSPHPDHHLVLATPPDSIDDGDITLATLSRFENQLLRTAQVSALADGTRLKILHLQGAGPLKSYRRAGAEPQALFKKFRTDTGLKPINTLLAALALEARERGFEELIWAGGGQFYLQPEAILSATQFREDVCGQLRLLLETPEDRILNRVTGKCPKKRAAFGGIRERFHTLFDGISKEVLYISEGQ